MTVSFRGRATSTIAACVIALSLIAPNGAGAFTLGGSLKSFEEERQIAVSQHAQIVCLLGHMRKQFAHGKTTFPVPMKPPRGLQQIALLGKRHTRQIERKRLPMITIQQRLWIKRIDVRRASLHEEENDAFGTRKKVRLTGGRFTLPSIP